MAMSRISARVRRRENSNASNQKRGKLNAMTVKRLSQLYYLNREIEMNKRQLCGLEMRSRGKLDAQAAAEAADIRGIIEAKHRQCLHERNRLERYISGIDDSLIRQIFTYRFVNGLSWAQVAAHIGGGNTEGGVKMLCYRYLRQTRKKA